VVICKGRLGRAHDVAGLDEQTLVREATTGSASDLSTVEARA
jgi:hypothetical protein